MTNYIKNILKPTRAYQLSIPSAYRIFAKVANRILQSRTCTCTRTRTRTEGYCEPGNYARE